MHEEPGANDVVLAPGVSMYLPTGTPHAARTQETASLHVTVGINQITWRDVLRDVTAEVLREEQYDAPVPAGYLENPGSFTEELQAHLAALGRRLPRVDAETAAGRRSTRFLTQRASHLRHGFTDRLALGNLTDDSRLDRRPGATCVLRPETDRLRVLLGDREIEMPSRLEEPMTFVRDAGTLLPRDLDRWLDPQSRLVLTRRLIREGLLQVRV